MSERASIQEMLTQQIGAMFSEIEETRKLLLISAREARKVVEPFIGTKEAASYLNMCVATLEKRMQLPDGPPRYIDGGKISFLRSELRTWRRQWRAGDTTGLEE